MSDTSFEGGVKVEGLVREGVWLGQGKGLTIGVESRVG